MQILQFIQKNSISITSTSLMQKLYIIKCTVSLLSNSEKNMLQKNENLLRSGSFWIRFFKFLLHLVNYCKFDWVWARYSMCMCLGKVNIKK